MAHSNGLIMSDRRRLLLTMNTNCYRDFALSICSQPIINQGKLLCEVSLWQVFLHLHPLSTQMRSQRYMFEKKNFVTKLGLFCVMELSLAHMFPLIRIFGTGCHMIVHFIPNLTCALRDLNFQGKLERVWVTCTWGWW